ncbi:hypothetical protein UFOVP1_49 [uncultured Caudovirales phage]|uniref:C1q domain containing protein n=1 Tax=uncultured Caudovirales phage TaxID=2100421 RepID=A0A6J5KL56_9CAUD|nr:hypothetical protein UFOVP1_49 [uncultured Caudovirales phage]
MPGYVGQGYAQFFDLNGDPLAGGFVNIYAAGTTTPVDTYSDWTDAVNQTNPQPNPVPLDSEGKAIIIINVAVKLEVLDSNLNVINPSVDNYAIADASDVVSGNYHFDGSQIVDSSGDPAFGFVSAVGADSYILLASSASNTAPVISVVDSGVTNQDLILTGQAGGNVIASVVAGTGVFKVNSWGNNISIAPTTSTNGPIIATYGVDTNIALNVTPQGTGTINLNAPTVITGNATVTSSLHVEEASTLTGSVTISNSATVGTTLEVSGATTLLSTLDVNGGSSLVGLVSCSDGLSVTGAVAITGSATVSGSVTTSTSLTTPSLILSSGSYTATYESATLSANKTFNLPAVDGTIGQFLKTDGSGNWSFATPPNTAISGAYFGTASTVTLSSASSTVVPFTTVFDISSYCVSGTYTPTIPGYYLFIVTGGVLSLASTSGFYFSLYKNGFLLQAGQFQQSTGVSGATTSNSLNALVHASTGTDYYNIYAYQGDSTGRVLNGATLTIQYIGS